MIFLPNVITKREKRKGKKYHPVYHHLDEEKEDNHQHPVEKKDTAGKGRE